MFNLKLEIAEIIYSSMKKPIDRKGWLGPELAELGLKHHGLDDISLDEFSPLVALYANGSLDASEILTATEADSSNFHDYIDTVSEYDLLSENPSSGKYELTGKGTSACEDFFKKVVNRKRFELKRELEHIESIYSQLQEL